MNVDVVDGGGDADGGYGVRRQVNGEEQLLLPPPQDEFDAGSFAEAVVVEAAVMALDRL